MKKIILKNGLTVLYRKKRGNIVTVEVMIKTGSNDELSHKRGIAHLIEHLTFEGTTKRPTGKEIANSIESIGGELNAYTTPSRTNYYITVLNRHFSLAADVLSDITFNPTLSKSHLLRERKVVLKEIEMLFDDPQYYQWVLLKKTLFANHPVQYPTYGNKKNLLKLVNKDIHDFFTKHYVPKNMVLSIVGDLKLWKPTVKKYFGKLKLDTKTPNNKKKKTTKLTRNITKKEKRPIANTSMVLGFKTVPRNHKDSYVLDVIDGILGRGQSGRVFNELREKRGLAYDVGSRHVTDIDFGYFALYAIIDKKNISLVKRLMKKEIQKLKDIDEQDILESKTYIEGNYYHELESTQQISDNLLFWEHNGSANSMKQYIKNIKNVTKKDIQRIIKKYFNFSATVILEGKQ